MPAAFSSSKPARARSGDGWACSESGLCAARIFIRNGSRGSVDGTEADASGADDPDDDAVDLDSAAPSATSGDAAIHAARSRAPPTTDGSMMTDGDPACAPSHSSASGLPDDSCPSKLAMALVEPHA